MDELATHLARWPYSLWVQQESRRWLILLVLEKQRLNAVRSARRAYNLWARRALVQIGVLVKVQQT